MTPRKSSQSEEERKQPVRNQDEPRDYKEIWQNAIKQQILLIRMDKENKKMQGRTIYEELKYSEK